MRSVNCLVGLLIAAALTGCGIGSKKTEVCPVGATGSPRVGCVDNKVRNQIFLACLERVPKGPNSIVGSNDWDEVIDSCESAAYYQSRVSPVEVAK